MRVGVCCDCGLDAVSAGVRRTAHLVSQNLEGYCYADYSAKQSNQLLDKLPTCGEYDKRVPPVGSPTSHGMARRVKRIMRIPTYGHFKCTHKLSDRTQFEPCDNMRHVHGRRRLIVADSAKSVVSIMSERFTQMS